MGGSATQKQSMLEAMAAHVLRHGLNTASLRPLARAAGRSDRMLLYHFGSKDRLIAELLLFLAADLADKLDRSLPPRRSLSVRDCITEIMALLCRPPLRDYMRLWLEIVAAASHGAENHARVGGMIAAGYMDWLTLRLPEDTPDMPGTVALVLTFIEGTLVMNAVGQAAIADAALDRLFAG